MANLDLLVKALDTAHWEMGEAFKGLPDDRILRGTIDSVEAGLVAVVEADGTTHSVPVRDIAVVTEG